MDPDILLAEMTSDKKTQAKIHSMVHRHDLNSLMHSKGSSLLPKSVKLEGTKSKGELTLLQTFQNPLAEITLQPSELKKVKKP